jgi:pimeloyl-ACP methyl ester carboxylesterase
MERVHQVVDQLSTMDTFNHPSVRDFILFVHGIFGHSHDTWGRTPLQLISGPAFSDFDYGSYGYQSKIIDRRDPETFVDQFILWLRTKLHNYERIYLAGHSMGGVFVRHAVTKMLDNPEHYESLAKIRRCFLIASPIAGSGVARALRWIPCLTLLNRRVRYLAHPSVGGIELNAAFGAAIERARKRGVRSEDIPHFHHYLAVNDILVRDPSKRILTEFDTYEGPVHGSHATLKHDLDANSVLLQSITQRLQDSTFRSVSSQLVRIQLVRESTRKREEATAALAKGVNISGPGNGPRINVVLMSCSATKSDAHGGDHPKRHGIGDQLEDQRLAKVVLEMRSRVLRLIQEGKIDGIEFEEGNRAAKPSNQKLIFGPDFGGVFNDGRYLPAYQRYTGRCYQASASEWAGMYSSHMHPQVLVMSGLYGLIPATEFIQNYDVHLTDVDLEASISIQTYWKDRELMTQVLIANLEWIQKNRGPIGFVIDALSELSYQETINWSLIDRRWNVMHRVFEARAGRHALGNLGVWIRDVIRNPTILDSLEADRFYENGGFHVADRIAFERQIGRSTLPVARETDN